MATCPAATVPASHDSRRRPSQAYAIALPSRTAIAMLALPVRVWPAYVPRVASASFVVEPDGTAVLDSAAVAAAGRGSGGARGTGGLGALAAAGRAGRRESGRGRVEHSGVAPSY